MAKVSKCYLCGRQMVERLDGSVVINGHKAYEWKDADGMTVTPFAHKGRPVVGCYECTRKRGYHSDRRGHINGNGDETRKTESENMLKLWRGIEWELDGIDTQTANECGKLVRAYGGRFEDDSTVTCECISALLKNGSSIAPTMKSLYNIGARTTSRCGTHYNLSTSGRVPYRDAISNYYNTLLTPISNWMSEHESHTARVFGRSFGRWAQPINYTSHYSEHSNWLSMEKSDRLEFRLCRWNATDESNGVAEYTYTRRVCEKLYAIIIEFGETITNYENANGGRVESNKNERFAIANAYAEKLIKAVAKA